MVERNKEKMKNWKSEKFLKISILIFIFALFVFAFPSKIAFARDFIIRDVSSSTNVFFMVQGTSGKVGVGTATPTYKLDVVGDIRATGVIIGTVSTTISATNVSAGSFGANTGGGNYSFPANLTVSGNVGIGTTSPGATLHVRQTDSGQTPSNVVGLFVENNGTANNYYVFQTATVGGGKSFSITNAGNVGIGTTIPGAKLSVSGGVSIGSSYAGTSVGDGNLIISGNVGIGTTNPGFKLDVNGSVRVAKVFREGNWRHVLSDYFTTTPANGVLLTTAIPYDGVTNRGMHKIRVVGYAYGESKSIDFEVVFYLYSSGFNSYSWTNYGAHDPGTIKLSYEGNVVKLWWSSKVYFASYEVFTQSHGSYTQTDSWFEGWDISNAAAPTTNVVDVPYKNAMPYGLTMRGNINLNGNWLSGDGDNEGVFIDGVGNIGIGTAVPAKKLDVYGGEIRVTSNDTTGALVINRVSNPDQALYLRGGAGSGEGRVASQYSLELKAGLGGGGAYNLTLSTAAGEAMRILGSNNNIGIGTTSPSYKLDVSGDIRATGTIYGTFSGTINAANVSAGSFGANTGGGNYSFPANLTVDTDTFFVDATNNRVGIGTTSPGALLEVAKATGYNSDLVRVRDITNAITGGLGIDGAGSYWGTALFLGGNKVFTVESNYGLLVGSGYQGSDAPANGAIIAGNVGIGTTSPSVKLHVYESDAAKSGALINIATTSSSYYSLNVQSGGTSRLYVRADGNIGIGTTSPSQKLDVQGSINVSSGTFYTEVPSFIFRNLAGSWKPIGAQGLNMGDWDSDPNYGDILVGNYDFDILKDDLTSILKIKNTTGNVGIGTTSPSYKLDVSGDIRATGTIYGTFSGTINAANVSAGSFGANTGGGNYSFPANLTVSGAVGIGTTNPGVKLDVVGGYIRTWGGEFISYKENPGGILGALALEGKNASSTNPYMKRWTLFNMQDYSGVNGFVIYEYYDANNDGSYCNDGGACNMRFIIASGGNVGIGTATPAYPLDVVGDVRFSGTLQGGSVPWARLTSFPSACSAGNAVTGLGTTLTCSPFMTNPMTTLGDIIYGGSSGTPTRLAGSAGFLKSTGAAAPSWSAVNLATSDVTGTLPVTKGGTGLSSIAAGTILYATSSNTLIAIAPTAANQVLRSTAANALQFGSLVAADIPSLDASKITSGTFPIARGGTNTTATPTAGAVAYGTGSAYAFSAAGTANQVLISGGSGAPTWSNIASLLTQGTNITISGTTNATIATVNNPTFSTSVSTPLLTSSGAIAIKPGSNSTTAIQLQNTGGTAIVNVDTTNSRVGINNASPSYALDITGDIRVTGAIIGTVSTTISATNVSAGAFGSNTGGGNYSFPARVGIGTTSPSTDLHIKVSSGDVKIQLGTQASVVPTTGGPNNPSAAVDDSSNGGSAVWSNPTNVYTSNDVYASVTIPAGVDPDYWSDYLKATGFGFSLPSTANILGIKVEIEAKASVASTLTINEVLLVKSGSIVGSSKSGGLLTASDAYYSFGDTTDLWGTTWSYSDINNSNFGVVVSVFNPTTSARTAYIDHIRITVYYTSSGDADWQMAVSSTSGAFIINPLFSGGRVGIGTTTPSATLDINGTLNVNGIIQGKFYDKYTGSISRTYSSGNGTSSLSTGKYYPDWFCALSKVDATELDTATEHAYCTVTLDGNNQWLLNAVISGVSDQTVSCSIYCIRL